MLRCGEAVCRVCRRWCCSMGWVSVVIIVVNTAASVACCYCSEWCAVHRDAAAGREGTTPLHYSTVCLIAHSLCGCWMTLYIVSCRSIEASHLPSALQCTPTTTAVAASRARSNVFRCMLWMRLVAASGFCWRMSRLFPFYLPVAVPGGRGTSAPHPFTYQHRITPLLRVSVG